jgi:hypothetical protein
MESTMSAPSFFEVVFAIAMGIVIAVGGARSKWKYVRQDEALQAESTWESMNSAIKVRVRRLAIFYVVCLYGMALALLLMILSRSAVFLVIAFLFGITIVFVDLFLYLDTRRR